MPLTLRTLRPDDAAALLAFELANRDWFERKIEAREADFYTPAGVAAHVAHYLQALQRREMYPGLLVDEAGVLVGRANLRNIDLLRGRGEIGYRIGEAFCGRGHASLAVALLKGVARDAWRLKTLEAFVTVENPASARVLEKNGFVRRERVEEHAEVGGRLIDSLRFTCAL